MHRNLETICFGICFVSFFEVVIAVVNSELEDSQGLLVKITHASAPREMEVMGREGALGSAEAHLFLTVLTGGAFDILVTRKCSKDSPQFECAVLITLLST